MKGFGHKQRPVKARKEIKRALINPSQIRDKAIQAHLSGDVESAENHYKEFIDTGINDPDVFSNYALILQEKGELEKALLYFEKCIKFFPKHIFSNTNLGYLYLSLGRLKEAEIITRKAIDLQPDLPNSYSILGLIYKAKGNFLEAEKVTQNAIKLNPKFIDAYINLGLILKSAGKLKEAEKATLEAIKLNPDSPEGYLNLGSIYQDQGNLRNAAIETKKAMKINSNIPDVNMNLSGILKESGELEEAVYYATKEINLYPSKDAAYLLLASLLKDCNLSKINKIELRNLLAKLINRRDINHNELFHIFNYLYPKETIRQITESQKNIIREKAFKRLASDKEIVKGLRLSTFHSVEWEQCLTKIRSDICSTCLSSSLEIKKNILEFTVSLAIQCFLNEYIFHCTEYELEAVSQLKKALINDDIDELQVAVLACYVPLFKLDIEIGFLKDQKFKNKSLNELISVQLEEPREEVYLATSLEKLGEIKDVVSKKVKDQYEENPYPRWRYSSYLTANKSSIYSAINNEIRPNRLEHEGPKKFNRILIAGCGTGQQLLDTARYLNSEITAIDLSASSIAYAKRKIKEYDIKNIKFLQMDILDISQLGEEFDLIECSGVLHHMNKPESGLKELQKSLVKGGVIKLALYSELARKDIINAREIIESNKIPPSSIGIRSFRQDLISGKYPDIIALQNWADFYTTSMCRDLCFHIQEHRYTIPKIDSLINSLNLTFLGFVLDREAKEKYSMEYPSDISQIDLRNWAKFEISRPNTFRAMYQFWLKKQS